MQVLRLLLCYGGKDISYFFDKENKPLSTVPMFIGDSPYYFKGAYETAFSHFSKTFSSDLWEDPLYVIGQLTKRERNLNIINTLTGFQSIYKIKIKWAYIKFQLCYS